MLELNNVEVVYSDVIQVLRGVSLEVPEGKIVGLLGANGAGKSTTLKAISGLLRTQEGEVTRGSIELDGQRIDRLPPEKIVQLGIIQVLEGRRLFRHLTVEENLLLGALGSQQRFPAHVWPARIWSRSTTTSPGSRICAGAPAATSPAASSRCWSSGGR